MKQNHRIRNEVIRAGIGVLVIVICSLGLSLLIETYGDGNTTSLIIGITGGGAAAVASWLCVRALRAEHELQRRLDRLTGLHTLVRTVTSSLDLRDVLSKTLTHCIEVLKGDGGLIWLSSNADIEGTDGIVSENLSSSLINRVLPMIKKSPTLDEVVIMNVYGSANSNPCPEMELLDGITPSSQIAYVKIMRQGHLYGAVAIWRQDRVFTKADSDLLKSVALATSEAISNARKYEKTRSTAERDAVTGLFNHRAAYQRIDAEVKRVRRTGSALSIVMMDINNFKIINDTYGHPAGDEVLRTVSRSLLEVCRGSDILARYGGDEFIAVLPDTTAIEAEALLRRLNERIEQFSLGNPYSISFTLSYGISQYPVDGNDVSGLIAVADTRLYADKNNRKAGEPIVQRDMNKEKALPSFLVLDEMVGYLDRKDKYSRKHAELTSQISLQMAQALGYSEETMRTLRTAALLHDIGMIGIPDNIINKETKLTPEETEIVRRHPTLGAQIVGSLPGMEQVAEIIRAHHERYSGDGYPDGLAGDKIPVLARLLSVADAYSAMSTDKTHRKSKPKAMILEEISRNSGSQFDPVMVESLLKILDENSDNNAAA